MMHPISTLTVYHETYYKVINYQQTIYYKDNYDNDTI